MDTVILRILCLISIFLFVLLFKRPYKKLESILSVFLFFSLIGELVTQFYDGFNLVIYAFLSFLQVITVAYLLYNESKKIQLPATISFISLCAFIFMYFTNFSTYELLRIGLKSNESLPISLHQFFDLSTLYNLSIILLIFTWLISVAQRDDLELSLVYQKYFIVFSFLLHYGGSFFMIAFGRLLLPSYEDWFAMWALIFTPLLTFFYITLGIGIIWKPTH